MSELTPWNRQLLVVIVSQICKTIGWHTITTTSLQVLVDVLHRYLKQMGSNIHDYSTHFNHTMPTLEDLNIALKDMGVNIDDLKEYADYVAPFPIKTKVPQYPLEKKSSLNFLKPGSREVVTRPFHIHEHLPAMRPELPEENYPTLESTNSENSALPSLTDTAAPSTFDKPNEHGDHIINKRLTNVLSQEMGKPVRELKCIMMTTSGFLSPAIEGKTPEARLPKPVHNIVKVEPPPPEATSTPLAPEPKSEHKKSSHSKSSSKSAEKKNRTSDENHTSNKDDNNDESKIKKVAHNHSKEASKVKVPKPISIVPVEPVPVPIPVPVPETPAIIRQEKLKVPQTIVQKEPKPPKQTKAEKKLEKIQQEQQMVASEKLNAEPHKQQKLSVFRRIAKGKEDKAESPAAKNVDDKNASISESIESVVRNIGEKESGKHAHAKEHPPMNPEELRLLSEQIPNPNKRIKRKKKKKIRDEEPSAKKMKLVNEVPDEIERPKPVAVPEQPLPYTFFTQLPDSLETNYLIPRFANPFANMTKLDPNCPHPEMPNLPLPPPMAPSTFVDNRQRSPAKSVEMDKKLLDPQLLNITDKKLKKKMKKDKKEKDKKKREKKEKLKLKKEKLEEKKQDKLLKKEKNKEKLKLKSSKKKNKLNVVVPKEEILIEDPSVPKIKLRIGGTNSPLPSPSGINVSIVKPDEPSMRDIRDPSPELAKMPALVGKPSKVKNTPKITIESIPLVPKQTVEPITVSTKGKKASVVNAETKTKNKEKSAKSKKTDGHSKSKPTPYYFDADGNQVWICPTCSRPDDGSPMIGCDGCDAWYHWVCVGIKSAPESAKWFCPLCLSS